MESKKGTMETKNRLVVARDKGYEEGNSECGQKVQISSFKIGKFGKQMCSRVTIVDNTALHI